MTDDPQNIQEGESVNKTKFDSAIADDNDQYLDDVNSNSVRRKSSWAFWTNEDGNPPVETEPSESQIESVIIDGKEHNVKERSSSWSFWSSKAVTATENKLMTNSILDSGINSQETFKIPDVVKSDIVKSKENTLKKAKPTPAKIANIVTPTIAETLPLYGPQTMINHGYKYIKSMFGYNDLNELHLYRRKSPKSFKRVLIIGVHGFFPTKMIRPIIGQPTGTSMKFAQVGETAVLEWAKENGFDIEIQKIALEKEGKIFDRVDFYFDILKKSADAIKEADFIFVCAHSQGTPVSMMLISKLLEYGIINKGKTIGILGMAGINMGPFYGMDKSLLIRAYSAIENASLLELFQFQNFESLQHRKYIESLRNLILNDVKITFIGSIDDQLVPLYSSIASQVQHPNIFKAVYIDGTTNTPAFVSRIVKLSCILQNIGYNDHGVIREMSHSLAGPITGGGHSKIYNDLQVYKTALDFTLKTEVSNFSVNQPVKLKPFDIKKLGATSNPYNLPWCARGLFFEATRRLPNGQLEVESVFTEFDDWKPNNKALEDVKYRLNGIKAKL